ncbi:MAG: carbonic anhydrase [Alphaproteobacteria bacterium]|nr:carbonic anhydrase [Alphaproteobacteria bacterium]
MASAAAKHPVVEALLEGNARFLNGSSLQSGESSLQKLKDFAQNGQSPKAIVLCCSDSRAPVEMIFDQDIGDLFVIRVAGNIVAPSLVGSVEFAASKFGTQMVVVMGHTHCGAVTATMEHITDPQSIPSENLHDIVSRIRPHVFAIAQMPEMPAAEKISRAVEANVRASVDQLSHSSRIIEALVLEGKLTIAGAVLDLATGKVNFLDP